MDSIEYKSTFLDDFERDFPVIFNEINNTIGKI